MASKYPVRTFEYAKCLNVVDGDTVDLELDLGFNIKVKVRFRLANINTPERGGHGWYEATQYVTLCLLEKSVIVKSTKVDKYGRYLAEIYDQGLENPSINERLLEMGLAILYS